MAGEEECWEEERPEYEAGRVGEAWGRRDWEGRRAVKRRKRKIMRQEGQARLGIERLGRRA